MTIQQLIVLPRAIPKVFSSPADIRAFLGEMITPMREVITAHPLASDYEVDCDYMLPAFITHILARTKTKKRWRWEKYNRKSPAKRKKPYATWFLNQLRKYLNDNRTVLANLPLNPFKPGTGRPVPKPSRTKLVVIFQRPRAVAPTNAITLDDDDDPAAG